MQNADAHKGRIEAIDLARAVALVAMAVYHFAWDLEFFGYAHQGMTTETGWKLFARAIASSFLFLVGVSLVLAHGQGIRWRRFAVRLAQISAAALAITAATWYATPDSYIFFGILHQIALASVLGLAFLRLPWFVTLLVAGAVILLPYYIRPELFAHPLMLWTGLSPLQTVSNDFVPLFPWFGAVLAGIAIGELAVRSGAIDRLRAETTSAVFPAWLTFPGRHSLFFYLVHQPVMIACVWLAFQVAPPSVTVGDARPGCERQCRETRSDEFCALYCLCVLDALDEQGILTPVMRGKADEAQNEALGAARDMCVGKAESGEPVR